MACGILGGLEGGRCAPHIWAIFQVEPFASLSEAVRSSVPRLLINRDLVGPFAWRPRGTDVVQLGDVVQGVERLVELLGWTEELQELVQQETDKVQTVKQGPLKKGCLPHCPGVWVHLIWRSGWLKRDRKSGYWLLLLSRPLSGAFCVLMDWVL